MQNSKISDVTLIQQSNIILGILDQCFSIMPQQYINQLTNFLKEIRQLYALSIAKGQKRESLIQWHQKLVNQYPIMLKAIQSIGNIVSLLCNEFIKIQPLLIQFIPQKTENDYTRMKQSAQLGKSIFFSQTNLQQSKQIQNITQIPMQTQPSQQNIQQSQQTIPTISNDKELAKTVIRQLVVGNKMKISELKNVLSEQQLTDQFFATTGIQISQSIKKEVGRLIGCDI
ncbi:hypothetical protein SS50377_24758 [Spironucleus salmonicida]|uniref:Uncharacterized protein n=1 Tax=Spironucleus salmonicida TaxID=348837 RepID=V6LV08_9EUKA|nr:hypothetical protein SS50377_24758 [Spironucleus salmonicida]|eukprot:EST44639.1 Hypothetical protein SS50377_15646 [Spironucleus salmonicida]